MGVGLVNVAAPTFPPGTSHEAKSAELLKRLSSSTDAAQLMSAAAGVGQLAKEGGPHVLEVRLLSCLLK